MAGYIPEYANRIDRLARQQQRMTGFVAGGDYYKLRVAPTCPPSKRLHVHGGRTNLSYNWGGAAWDDYEWRAYFVPDLVADLSDPTSVAVTVTFTNTNHYQLFILNLLVPSVVENPSVGDWSFYLHGTGDELETAAEAQEWLHSGTFQLSDMLDLGSDYGTGYPLCGVVLRNDGQTDTPGAFLPIDVVNRGRSFTWPRDMRERFPIYA